ncbi:MAG: hypothetical protein IJ213_07100 [Bacteroidales bacterium]|nr:hypothetical protein [Bacteroidales bacterium]
MNSTIINKLNAFIRSYYKNLVVKGLIYSALLFICCFVVLSLIEYFGWNSPLIRTIIFYSFIIFGAIIVFILIIIPLGKIFSIGKTLSYNQAAKIIGNHFPEIQDKLINLLQLKSIQTNSEDSLLLAAIEQKEANISPIPFSKAINRGKTKKYGKYLLVSVVVLVILFSIFPKLFSEPTVRYINHNTFYEKPAPFSFVLKNKDLNAIQQNDYTIEVQIIGKVLPDKTRIYVDGQSFEMKQKDKSHFSYTINQIQNTSKIQFEAANIKSKEYTITVNPKPIITELKAQIVYPAYTRIKNEEISNVTNLSIPKGTKINWYIKTKDTESILFSTNSSTTTISPQKNVCNFSKTYLKQENISIKTKNNYTLSSDSTFFSINIIEDERPQIAIIEDKDSTLVDNVYFRGQIKDDYGFSKLEFHIDITDKDNKTSSFNKKLNVTNSDNVQEFYHFINLNDYNVKAGDKIEYYFEVWDNDAINGAKSTKSQSFSINIPTEKEVEQKIDNNNENIKEETDKAIEDIKKLQQQINELSKKLTEKKELSWQDKKELEALKEKQQKVKERVSEIKQKMQENSMMEEKYSNINEELMQKQMELEKLFEKLENDELKQLLQQLEELTQKNLNKDKVNEALQDIKNRNEELNKELDRNLELFKRLEVEKEINETIDKLNELSKKQKELAQETKKGEQSKQTLNSKQEEINKEFKELQQKMNEIKKKDSSLEDPFNFKKDVNKEQEINKELEQAKDNINKGKNKNASHNQENAAQQMQQMADDIEQNQQENADEQLGEDIDNVRQILKNLVTLSKEQENMIYLSQTTSVSDPAYQNIINKQNTIKESMKDISDSLYNISKRQPQVSKTIFEETYKVRESIEKSLNSLLKFNQSYYNNYHNNQAANSQQYAMSSMNNLALLLAESLNNMNQQQQQSKNNKNGQPKNSCKNPGQGKKSKPSIKDMRQMQEALNKEIKRLQKELEKQGNNPKQKIGEGAKLNEELAKAAAQQEMIRKMMQEYINKMKEENAKSAGGESKALKQMEQTEKDIVNKKINANTIKRQNEILTRMLESEKAEKQQGKDSQRKSNTGVDKNEINIENLETFKKLKNRDLELFKKIPPVYSPYYNLKVREYFYNFENSNQNKK